MFSANGYDLYIIRYGNNMLYSENNKEILTEMEQGRDSTLAEFSEK